MFYCHFSNCFGLFGRSFIFPYFCVLLLSMSIVSVVCGLLFFFCVSAVDFRFVVSHVVLICTRLF